MWSYLESNGCCQRKSKGWDRSILFLCKTIETASNAFGDSKQHYLDRVGLQQTLVLDPMTCPRFWSRRSTIKEGGGHSKSHESREYIIHTWQNMTVWYENVRFYFTNPSTSEATTVLGYHSESGQEVDGSLRETVGSWGHTKWEEWCQVDAFPSWKPEKHFLRTRFWKKAEWKTGRWQKKLLLMKAVNVRCGQSPFW